MTKKSTTNENDKQLQYKNDQITLKMWRKILISGAVQGSEQWYWIRNLRGTLYGRTVFKHLMTFLSDEQNFDVMLDLVRECPEIMHPESVALNDTSRFLNEVSFYFKENGDRSAHADNVSAVDNPLDILNSLPESMKSYGDGEALEAVSEMSIEALAKLHSLDVIEKSNGRELRIIGRKSNGKDMADPVNGGGGSLLDVEGDAVAVCGDGSDSGIVDSGSNATGSQSGVGNVDGPRSEVDYDAEAQAETGGDGGVDQASTTNRVIIDGLCRKIDEILEGSHRRDGSGDCGTCGDGDGDDEALISGIPRFAGFSDSVDAGFVVEVTGSGGRVKPNPEQMEFVENNYPVLLMKDIALHSMITGDEVLIDVIDADWIPDPFRVNTDEGITTISSLDCDWLLSDVEKIVGEFLRVVYRSMAYGFYKGMTRKSPESFSDECWDALWEEASLDHEIILKIIDKTFPWGVEPGRRTIKMVESSVPEAYDMAQMRWKSGVNGDPEDVSVVDALRDLLTSLLVQTNRHDFDLHARCLNESVTFFEMSTYSVVLDARTVLGEEIDPLVPLPGTAFGLKTSDLVAEFERIITRLVSQDEIRLQYLGRRKSDGRLAFVYVDETGKTIVPEAAVKISM